MMKSKGKYALLRQAPRVAVLLIAMLPLQLQARGGYQISLQIKGGTDTLLYLGYYYAQNRYLLDSALCDRRGRFFFGGDRSLPDGLYFFSNREGRKMDFVIYHEKPQFTFRTDERDWERNMEVSGSKQNTVFFNFHRRMEALYDEMREGEANIDSAQLPAYRHAFYLRIDTLRLQTIEQHPEAMLSRLMMATKDPAAPPDSLTGNDRYFYVMHHFFDNVPLEEDFIVRTPREVFYERLTEYVDKRMRGLTPELAIPLLDSLIERAAPSEETFKYLVHTLTERYLQSTVMVYDEIYVHLVDRYWATGRATWADPSVVNEQIERADRWRRLLVGVEAPELILSDTLGIPHSLHRMPGRYTLLLFWSPTCGHCRDIIPALYTKFTEQAERLDMRAFAILSEPDDATIPKWHRFLKDHHIDSPRWINLNGAVANVDWHEVYDITSTPQIYLIDNHTHQIVAKKLNADLFEQICNQLK